MRLADAPLPGWYPDPEGGSLLRWWEGTDWTDQCRPALSARALAEMEAVAAGQADNKKKTTTARSRVANPAEAFARTDADELVGQVRDAARQEIDRAAQEISRSIQDSIARVRPAIVGYISQIVRWVRIGVVTAAVLVVVWFVIQFIAQATFLQWLGDRIDNFTD